MSAAEGEPLADNPAVNESLNRLRTVVAEMGAAVALIDLQLTTGQLSLQDRQRIAPTVGYLTLQVDRLQAVVESPDEGIGSVLSLALGGADSLASQEPGAESQPAQPPTERSDTQIAPPPAYQLEPANTQPGEALNPANADGDSSTPVSREKPPVSGRTIVRLDRETVTAFLAKHNPAITFEQPVRIVIEDDTTLSVNDNRQEMRIPKNGNHSVVMRVLNIALRETIENSTGRFSLNEITALIDDPDVRREAVWQAVLRFRTAGLLVNAGRSKQNETLFAMPKNFTYADNRPPIEGETPDFLAR